MTTWRIEAIVKAPFHVIDGLLFGGYGDLGRSCPAEKGSTSRRRACSPRGASVVSLSTERAESAIGPTPRSPTPPPTPSTKTPWAPPSSRSSRPSRPTPRLMPSATRRRPPSRQACEERPGRRNPAGHQGLPRQRRPYRQETHRWRVVVALGADVGWRQERIHHVGIHRVQRLGVTRHALSSQTGSPPRSPGRSALSAVAVHAPQSPLMS